MAKSSRSEDPNDGTLFSGRLVENNFVYTNAAEPNALPSEASTLELIHEIGRGSLTRILELSNGPNRHQHSKPGGLGPLHGRWHLCGHWHIRLWGHVRPVDWHSKALSPRLSSGGRHRGVDGVGLSGFEANSSGFDASPCYSLFPALRKMPTSSTGDVGDGSSVGTGISVGDSAKGTLLPSLTSTSRRHLEASHSTSKAPSGGGAACEIYYI